MVTNCSTLDGARQALLGVTVFPAILKTLSDLELLELQRQSVPCGREEEIGFRASSTKAVGRLHCLHLATVRSSSTPFQTCSAAKFSLQNFFTTLLEGTRLLDFWVHYPTLLEVEKPLLAGAWLRDAIYQRDPEDLLDTETHNTPRYLWDLWDLRDPWDLTLPTNILPDWRV